MEVKAKLNYLRIAPRKVRLVANLIKGMDVDRAELELEYLPKKSSQPIGKLLRSAVANAVHNFQLSKDNLFVKDVIVNQGPFQKRFMPRAFGRAAPIRKRTSHVSIVLESKSAVKVKASKKDKPVLRDVTLEDIKEESPEGRKREEIQPAGKAPRKQEGFVKRVFRRKAI